MRGQPSRSLVANHEVNQSAMPVGQMPAQNVSEPQDLTQLLASVIRDAADISVDHHGEKRAKEEGEAVDVTHSQGDDVEQDLLSLAAWAAALSRKGTLLLML